jgi:hypothetical protein
MAIAHPFALNVKAFSAEYGELRHSVNAAGQDETKLKDSSYGRSLPGPVRQIALGENSPLFSRERL